MKLVLYSGYDEANDPIDAEAIRLTGKRRPRVVFIPSANHIPDFEYDYVCENFGEHGVKDIMLFNIDRPYSIADAERIINTADLIYLSGGNTFYFLKSIRRNHFDRLLIKFVQRGGVLAGLSAGAIIMTPSIMTASYPKFDRDENTVGIRSFEALGLVPFEFFPHYNPEPEYARELRRQSKTLKHPIYGVADGAGIVLEGRRLSFFGNIWGYFAGKQFTVLADKRLRNRRTGSR
jgi:dipeptidase E